MTRPALLIYKSHQLFASAILTVTNQIWFCFAFRPDHSAVLGYRGVGHKFISRTKARAATNLGGQKLPVLDPSPVIQITAALSGTTRQPEPGGQQSSLPSVPPARVAPLPAPVPA